MFLKVVLGVFGVFGQRKIEWTGKICVFSV